ncbi:hypothetical protein [Streptomyces sp. NBC_00483]
MRTAELPRRGRPFVEKVEKAEEGEEAEKAEKYAFGRFPSPWIFPRRPD